MDEIKPITLCMGKKFTISCYSTLPENKKSWREICAAMRRVKRIRLHDFRHSHASLLLNKEQNILLVAQRLGHSDIKMTLNTYSHLFPNKQRELMARLNVNLG